MGPERISESLQDELSGLKNANAKRRVFLGPEKVFPRIRDFPSFWRTLGELFSVNSYKNPCFCDEKAQFVHEILGKASDELCYWKTFLVPDFLNAEDLNASPGPERNLEIARNNRNAFFER